MTDAVGTATITVTVHDDGGTANGGVDTTTRTFEVLVELLPTVTLINPVEDDLYVVGDAIFFEAEAEDSDGTISEVQFYCDNTLLGSSSESPYYIFVDDITAGTHSVYATAVDDDGGKTSTTPISIVVDTPPDVTFTYPASDISVVPGSAINITGTATDSDTGDTIDAVTVYLNGEPHEATFSANSWSWTWDTPTVGVNSIVMEAVDNHGIDGESSVTLTINTPPTVAVTSPADNATTSGPVTITVSPADPDSTGSIVLVEFFVTQDSTLHKFAEITSPPFTTTWSDFTGFPAGTYTITVVAHDDLGGTATSTFTITIAGMPTNVAITSPANNASFVIPTGLHAGETGIDIPLTATATDPEDAITRVQLLANGHPIGQITEVPATFTWRNVAAGVYTLTACATDAQGCSVTSDTPITITVKATPSIAIVSPKRNSTIVNNTATDIHVVASDPDGVISSVVISANQTTLTTTTDDDGWVAQWTPGQTGAGDIEATVTDNDNLTTTTTTTVTVGTSAQGPLEITNAATLSAGPITPGASTSVVIGGVSNGRVELWVQYANTKSKYATITSSPYTFTWVAGKLLPTDATARSGRFILEAHQYDTQGNLVDVTSVQVLVTYAPTATFTVTAVSGGAYTLAVSASDTDGSIAYVEFYVVRDSVEVLLTTVYDTYSYTWHPTQSGSVTLIAKTYDNLGAVTVSTQQITVNAPPTIALTVDVGFNPPTFEEDEEPSAGSYLKNYLTLSADAQDSDGTISEVTFYIADSVNGELIPNSNTNSGSYTGVLVDGKYVYHITEPSGPYTVFATATDNGGATAVAKQNVAVPSAPCVVFRYPYNSNTVVHALSVMDLHAYAYNPECDIVSLRFFTSYKDPATPSTGYHKHEIETITGPTAGSYVSQWQIPEMFMNDWSLVYAQATDSYGQKDTKVFMFHSSAPEYNSSYLSLLGFGGVYVGPLALPLAARVFDANHTETQVNFHYGESTTLAAALTGGYQANGEDIWTALSDVLDIGNYAINAEAVLSDESTVSTTTSSDISITSNIDLAIDSANSSKFALPDGSADAIESRTDLPGKFIDMTYDTQYVPITLTLQSTATNPVLHFKFPSCLSLLTKDATDNPDEDSVLESGDSIPNDTDISATLLGWSSSIPTVTLYVKSTDLDYQNIGASQVISVAEVDPSNTAEATRIISYDQVVVTPVGSLSIIPATRISAPDTVNCVAMVDKSGVPAELTLDGLIPWPVLTALSWGGGLPGAESQLRNIQLATPAKILVNVTLLDVAQSQVTAWVAKVDLAINGVADNMEDTQSALIHINTDDDDGSTIADKDETGPIAGENELVPLTLSIEPADIGGTLTITNSGGNTLLYTSNDKTTEATTLSWDLSTRLDTNTGNDENPPRVLYLEGNTLSSSYGDQHYRLHYVWSAATGTDNVMSTVVGNAGSGSSVKVEVYKLKDRTADLTQDNLDTQPQIVGGRVAAAIKLTVGANQRLDPAINNMTVRISDTYAYPENAYAHYDKVIPLNTSAGWYVLTNGNWVASTVTPNDTDYTTTPQQFMYLLDWFTQTTPNLVYKGVQGYMPALGHNGQHNLEIVAVDGLPVDTLPFQEYNSTTFTWDEAVPVLCDINSVMVQNLVVTSLTSSNGTVDYLKYDPIEGSQYHRPRIDFTIQDDGDPHKYHCWVMIQPTGEAGQDFLELGDVYSFAYTYAENECINPMPVSITWNGMAIASRDTFKGTYVPGEADSADWGTYTYDVIVQEYDEDDGTYLDQFAYKWPYCLTIGDHYLEANDYENGTGSSLDYEYSLYDAAYHNICVNAEDPSLDLVVIDNNLTEKSTINLDIEGLLSSGDFVEGTAFTSIYDCMNFEYWRTVYIGQDNCWCAYQRDHLPRRMLAVNESFIGWCDKTADKIVNAVRDEVTTQKNEIISTYDNPVDQFIMGALSVIPIMIYNMIYDRAAQKITLVNQISAAFKQKRYGDAGYSIYSFMIPMDVNIIEILKQAYNDSKAIRADMQSYNVHDGASLWNYAKIKGGDIAGPFDTLGAINRKDYIEAGRRFARLVLVVVITEQVGVKSFDAYKASGGLAGRISRMRGGKISSTAEEARLAKTAEEKLTKSTTEAKPIKRTPIKSSISESFSMRKIDPVADAATIARINEIRSLLNNSGNLGLADINIAGYSVTEYCSLSNKHIISDLLAERVPSLVGKPAPANRVLKPYYVNKNNRITVSTDVTSYLRDVDSEFKILNKIASDLGNNKNISGKILLYTDRPPCASCSKVITEFEDKYPYIDVTVIHK